MILLFAFGCNYYKSDNVNKLIEDTFLGEEFCDKIQYLVNSNDSVVELRSAFNNTEYDNIYIFPSYTPIKKINSLIGDNDGLPYIEEVKGNEDLFVLTIKNEPKVFFILKDNIIVSDLEEYKYEIESSSLLLRVFYREQKEIIYILNLRSNINE